MLAQDTLMPGAGPEGLNGYTQEPQSMLLPIIDKILSGETFTSFGNDYDTADGTNVRDYSHTRYSRC